nr:CRISPR-associated helicase Cas3' [Candidatus Freyarchaeota archaeon]
MASLWSKPFFSHPAHLLKDHLRDVGEASAHYVKSTRINNEALVKVAEIVGKTHDFGKYSAYFQRNLQGEKIEKKLRSHAPLSAIFTAWNVSRKFKDPFLTTVAYLCVLKHHGNLINFSETLNKFREFPPSPQSQLESIEENLPKISTELSEIGVQGIDEFITNIGEARNNIGQGLFHATRGTKTGWDEYFKTLILFSALIDADKKDAAKISKAQRRTLPQNIVDEYRKAVFRKQSTMDELRNELYESVMHFLEKLDVPPRIMTITAPTGSGKTLLSLSVALKLREQLIEQGVSPRIIYCLPFVNIIEQTNEVFSDVLRKGGCSINPEVLLKHHHLSIPVSEDEVPLHQALELQESWNSEIIVTTFVQLMHTLVGYRNSFLKKFHNMANAIIILDEVQTIPIEYWRLTRELFKNLTEKTSSHVILMTATQPLIFGEGEAVELVPHSPKYFEKLDRTHLRYNPEEMNIKDAAKLAQELWKRCQSLLVVVNTIQSSIELYENLRSMTGEIIRIGVDDEKLDDTNLPVIAYLSTNIIPKERKRRVELIKGLLREGKRKVLVVSTQVVEAGVDLDFDAVIRDIAPTDSINQVAGRCNRSGRLDKGEVHIINLRDEKGNPYATRVYSKEHVRISKKLLEEKREASEKDFLKMVREYFQKQAHYEGYCDSDESKSNIKSIVELNFDNLSEFSLIEDEPTEAIFVEYDPEAKEALMEFTKRLEEFRKAERGDDTFKKRAILRAARVKLEDYILNIRKQDCHQKETIQETTIRYLGEKYVEEMYDRETGYKRNTIHPAIW